MPVTFLFDKFFSTTSFCSCEYRMHEPPAPFLTGFSSCDNHHHTVDIKFMNTISSLVVFIQKSNCLENNYFPFFGFIFGQSDKNPGISRGTSLSSLRKKPCSTFGSPMTVCILINTFSTTNFQVNLIIFS